MLAYSRFYQRQLTDDQCQKCLNKEFEWDPLLEDPTAIPDDIQKQALKQVCRSRGKQIPTTTTPLKGIMTVGSEHFSSLSGRIWKPVDLHKNPYWKYADCGGGGNCFFYCCAAALGLTQQLVRNMTAQMVDKNNVDKILKYYAEKFQHGNWDKKTIMAESDIDNRVKMLQEVMKKSGFLYQGDDVTMKLLVMHPKAHLGFIVIDREGEINPHVFMSKNTKRLVVLRYIPGHWQLIGRKLENDSLHRIQTSWNPFQGLPSFLTERLAKIGVDVDRDFADWEPRLELEEK